jgi:hypothetical protein
LLKDAPHVALAVEGVVLAVLTLCAVAPLCLLLVGCTELARYGRA